VTLAVLLAIASPQEHAPIVPDVEPQTTGKVFTTRPVTHPGPFPIAQSPPFGGASCETVAEEPARRSEIVGCCGSWVNAPELNRRLDRITQRWYEIY
jgi:hypothetical protein